MASEQQLKEANYIARINDEYIDGLGQCGMVPCDHSKMLKDNITGKEYRYCMKLQMPVNEYDSCKYHGDTSFVAHMQSFIPKQQESEPQSYQKSIPKKKKGFRIGAIVCLCILVYLWLK